MAYHYDKTGKQILIKEIDKLMEEIKGNVHFGVPLEELTYAELNSFKNNLQSQCVQNNFHTL